jgi:hypothetical protein
VVGGPVFSVVVPNDAGDDQIGIVESGAERMAQRVAKFTAFMD